MLKTAAQTKEKESSKKSLFPASATPVIKERTKFDIDTPTLLGKPTDWRTFFELFSSTLEARGKHLTDKEKHCKAMMTDNTRNTVLIHAEGEDSYDEAV